MAIELPDRKRLKKVNLNGYKNLGNVAVTFHHEQRNEGKHEKRIHQKSENVTSITTEWGKCYSRDEYMEMDIIRYVAGVLDLEKIRMEKY